MLISGDAAVTDQFAQPRIEPEIAFRLARDLDQLLDLEHAHRAADAVSVAAEIIGSRFAGFSFRAPRCAGGQYQRRRFRAWALVVDTAVR